MGLGSEIWKNLFRIPDPGVKKAPDPGSGSATLLSTISAGRTVVVSDDQKPESRHLVYQYNFNYGTVLY